MACEMQSDFLHHLSTETRRRLPNPMKSIWKLAQDQPDLISLANGDPHHSLYPISQIDFKVPSLAGDNPVEDWRSGKSASQTFSSYKDLDCALSLRTALQYGAGTGLPEVRKALAELNRLLHSPIQHTITLSLGNADGLAKCFRLLGDPDDSFLLEEFSFPGMTNAPLAHGIKWVPVRMDKEGMLPEVLELILQNWDESLRGRRPHVLYTIPCGQNPTGCTLSLERRRKIYQIASRWDLIILEDDPYYFLQYDRNPLSTAEVERDGFSKAFVRTLVPSFLSMDTEGRVVRIDSFSKIIVPGMRLGWITSNAMFAEKLETLTDSSTQHPHGFGQVFVAEMFGSKGWQVDGFMKWVSSLCDDYQRRRDLFLHALHREFGDSGLVSAETPSAGMFIWIKLNFNRHPRYRSVEGSGIHSNDVMSAESLTDELFHKLFAAGLIVMPAKTFAIAGACTDTGSEIPVTESLNHFRVTFASTDDVIERAVVIFGQVVREFFE